MSNYAASTLVNELPETDLVIEVKDLLKSQMDIIVSVLDGEILDTNSLVNFCLSCEDKIRQYEPDEDL